MPSLPKRFQPYALAALLLLCATGCPSAPTPGSGSSGGPGAPGGAMPSPTTVRFGYFANLTHAQAVLGVASGDFAEAIAPSKLETRVFNAGPSLIEALNAGAIDIGYVGPGPAISGHGRSHGEALRVVAGAAANGVVVVVAKDSKVTKLKELNGKKLGTPQVGNTQDIAAKHFIKDATGIIAVPNAEQRAMFENGSLEAAWVPEPWGAYLVSQAGAKILLEEKDLWPEKEFVLTLVVTTPKFLKEHPDEVENILKVHRSYTAKLVADPKALEPELGKALFELTKKSLPEGVVGTALTRIKFTDEPLLGSLEAMNKWTTELGFAREEASLEGLVDTTLLRKLQTAKETP